jgi:hypothetical protein
MWRLNYDNLNGLVPMNYLPESFQKTKFFAHQHIVKIWFDKRKAKETIFEVGDLVLKWDRENEPQGKNLNF